MIYYGTKLSDNISIRQPEGYLICLNVPVARTGYQDYYPQELGLPYSTQTVQVFRPEEEVFSEACIASFEGMPVTDDHPSEGVDINNIKRLGKGRAHNIRRGAGEESDLLLADLIIEDVGLIDRIMNQGKREVSCGYNYELCEEDGQYVQRQIRGNHIAVVDAGRAGPRVCIKDHMPTDNERRTHMKKSLYKKLVKMARDGDPEAIAAVQEIAEEILEAEAASDPAVVVAPVVETPAAPVAVAPAAEAPAAVVVETGSTEAPAATDEEPTLATIVEKLDQLIALLTPAAPAADEDPVDDPVAEIVEAITGAVEEAATGEATPEEATQEAVSEIAQVVEETVEANSETIEPEEGILDACEENPVVQQATADALRAVLGAVRPALTKLNKKQRQRVSADIAARLSKKSSGAYAQIAGARDSKPAKKDYSDLGKRIMEKRSANHK